MILRTNIIGLFTALGLGSVFAQSTGLQLEPLHFTGSFETGELVNFLPNVSGNEPSGVNVTPGGSQANSGSRLIDHASVWLLQKARLNENTQIFLGVGGMYFFFLPSQGNGYSITEASAFGLTDAHGEFEFWRQGEKDHGLLLKAGIFPFKYNEDAKNLGEYLFRTYTYPTVIFTGGLVLVNSAGAQLNGFDANTQLGGFKNDLLLTTQTDRVPSPSLSLTDIVSYNFRDFFTVGAGFMFDNFYTPDGTAEGIAEDTMPGVGNNEWYFTLKNGSKVLASTYIQSGDTTAIADTGHFTFVGQKAMVRASLNLGKLVHSSLLSDPDLRLYFEGILMGISNYPVYYQSMKNRIAYMFGLNLPTFHMLDFLSVEIEYCQNPYADNFQHATESLTPIPDDPNLEEFANSDNVKWTVYARKTVLKGFALSAQVANDHMRLVDYFGRTNPASVMQRPKNWYWVLQMTYSI